MEKRRKQYQNLDNKKLHFAYFPGKSLMHKLNPISKFIFLILLTITTLLIQSLILLCILSLLIIILALTIGISLIELTKKLRFILFILLISVVLNIFFNAIPSDEEIILFYLFGQEFLPIRRLAVYFAFKAFFTVIILFTSSIIYTNTTNMRDFLYSLISLRIPYKYCFALMVGIRYIPLIEQEAQTIALAQRARGFGRDKASSIRKVYKLISERLIATLVSILRKSNVTSVSMENRCFGIYKKRTNLVKIKFSMTDFLFMSCCIAGFLFLLLYLLGILGLPQLPSLYSIYSQFF